MKILAVIVNYHTADLVIRSMHALAGEIQSLNGCLCVTIVENNSRDGSFEKIFAAIEKSAWSDHFHIIRSPQNRGFASGNNLAIKDAWQTVAPDFIWLLNPDTIIRPGAAVELLMFLENNRRAAICGSRLEDADGTPQISTFKFPHFANEFIDLLSLGPVSKIFRNYITPQPVQTTCHKTQWVAGASVMIRREVFERIGLMDEHYFLYFEEVDFFFKAARYGYDCWYVPTSRVIHLVGASTGISDYRKKQPRRPGYWFESRRRFYLKNRGRFHAVLADLAFMLGHGLWVIKTRLRKKANTRPPHFFRDFVHHSVFCRGFHFEK